MSSIYEAFLFYRDKYGLNQLYTDGNAGSTSQNGVLFTLEYLICLAEDPNTSFELKYQETFRLREVLVSCEEKPGLLSRHPGSKECDSMDNNVAALTYYALLSDKEFAQRMLEHGKRVKCKGLDPEQKPENTIKAYPLVWLLSGFKRPRYFWNNQRPDLFSLSSWFGRSPGFMGYLEICATGNTSWFRKVALLVGQFAGCFADRGNSDARKLPYVIWYYLHTRHWIWNLWYKLWRFILLRQYPNGMRDVYSLYYQDVNQPIRRYSKPAF